MKTMRIWLAVLCLTGVTLAQTAAPDKEKPAGKKSELETMLEEAFKNNPDLRVAEAKFAEAQAELARVRIGLVQKVAKAAADLRAAERMEEESKRRHLRDQDLYKKSKAAISAEDLNMSRGTWMKYKGEAEAAEAALNALLGKVSDRDKAILGEYYKALEFYGVAARYSPKNTFTPTVAREREVPTGAMVDNLRKALEKKITLEGGGKVNDILEFLEKVAAVKFLAPRTGGGAYNLDVKEFSKIEGQTVAAVLAFLEDHVEGLTFVVREYGLLAVEKDKVPPGAITLKEFRKLATPTAPAKPTEDPGAKKTSDVIEGQVMKVDGDLVTLNIGADAGLTKGMELETFRLGTTPKYLGKLKVLEVTPTNAVARAVSKAGEPLKEGDRVASRLLGEVR